MAITSYLPASILVLGAAATFLVGKPAPTPLVQPLDAALPMTLDGAPSQPLTIGPDELRVSGVTDVFYRGYDVESAAGPVSLYVGYHATQQGDNRMHSPSQCLPGAGWTPVSSGTVMVPVAGATYEVNRYVLQKDRYRILVYYWFQGRGRVTAGETHLKLRTLYDALVSQRDEEALVRIVVPMDARDDDAHIGATGLSADSLATQFSATVIPALQRALPPAP